MTELTLEALGYRPDEARVARRLHDMLKQPQDPCASRPAWVSERHPFELGGLGPRDITDESAFGPRSPQ